MRRFVRVRVLKMLDGPAAHVTAQALGCRRAHFAARLVRVQGALRVGVSGAARKLGARRCAHAGGIVCCPVKIVQNSQRQ